MICEMDNAACFHKLPLHNPLVYHVIFYQQHMYLTQIYYCRDAGLCIMDASWRGDRSHRLLMAYCERGRRDVFIEAEAGFNIEGEGTTGTVCRRDANFAALDFSELLGEVEP